MTDDIIGNLIQKGNITIIAGPCAIENWKQLDETAKVVNSLGLSYLRGGAYKPRTSPYSFQGLEEKGLEFLKKVGEKYGLKTVTEVTDTINADIVAEYVDVLQIGTRNMSNFALLKKVGEIAYDKKKAVILKRGWSSTIKEWLLASEYLNLKGAVEVILCERGIRTFDTNTRFTLDLSAVPVIRKALQASHNNRSLTCNGPERPGDADEQGGYCRRCRRPDSGDPL